MQSRTNKLHHPLGIEIQTPLLIPSFSSKGFNLSSKGISETTKALEVTREFITDSLLISAYDIYHGHIPFIKEGYICTDITFIDSGGYETSSTYDISSTMKYNYPAQEWDINKYQAVINEWPDYKAAILVSYDHGEERYLLDEQITLANSLFSKNPGFLYDFLIKPETNTQIHIQMNSILERIHLMKNYSIIGVTEKELGGSILDRMKNISRLRSALDSININSPIHIFGSLDPITCLLYFLSGAEIFDGLTWLKYTYFNGSAIYQSNYGALNNELGIHVKDSQVKSSSIVSNIYYLDKIKFAMLDYISTGEFSVFESLGSGIGHLCEKAFKKLISNIK